MVENSRLNNEEYIQYITGYIIMTILTFDNVPYLYRHFLSKYIAFMGPLHTQIQKVSSEWVQLFLVDDGKEDPNTTINGPSSAR